MLNVKKQCHIVTKLMKKQLQKRNVTKLSDVEFHTFSISEVKLTFLTEIVKLQANNIDLTSQTHFFIQNLFALN